MRKVAAIALCAYVAVADEAAIDKLSARAMNLPRHNSGLDETTFAKSPVNAATKGKVLQIFPPPATAPQGGMAAVHAMQDTLRKHGIGSSPMQRFALTQLAATRDPSMKAEVKEVFSSLEPKLQAKMRSLSKEAVVRAEREVKKEDLAGAVAPLGYWDPLKWVENFDEGTLYFWREAELKNGRTAMLAFLGIIFADKFHPFYSTAFFGGPEPYVSPVASHYTDAMGAKFWPALAFVCGAFELATFPDGTKAPGDLGWDPLGLKPKTETALLEVQNKELSNGRLAMIAVVGVIGKELMTGEKVF
jgi:hypothetical protein